MAMGRAARGNASEAVLHGGVGRDARTPFSGKLTDALEAAGFDASCDQRCQAFHHDRLGRPSLMPGSYFRLQLIGFVEGVGSDRGIA